MSLRRIHQRVNYSDDTPWSCTKCTFQQDVKNSHCYMCNSKNPFKVQSSASVPQTCEYLYNGKWIPGKIYWCFVDQKISFRSNQNKRKYLFSTGFNSIFLADGVVMVEPNTQNDNEFIAYRLKFNVNVLIKYMIEKRLIQKCSWIMPLMYQQAEQDETLITTWHKLMEKYAKKDMTNKANKSVWDKVSDSVQDKLKAFDMLNDAICSMGGQHNQLMRMWEKEVKSKDSPLTYDAKKYVQEIVETGDQLWKLFLDVKIFIAYLEEESILNIIRINQWNKIQTDQALNQPGSNLYKKMEQSVKNIIEFGATDELNDKMTKIIQQISDIKTKLTKLCGPEQIARLKCINKHNKQIPFKFQAKLVIFGAFAGVTGCVLTGALYTIFSVTILSNPIGLAVGAGLLVLTGIIGCVYYAVKCGKIANQNRQNRRRRERLEKNFSKLEIGAKSMEKQAGIVSEAIIELKIAIIRRKKCCDMMKNGDDVDLEILERLKMHFKTCSIECKKVRNTIKTYQ